MSGFTNAGGVLVEQAPYTLLPRGWDTAWKAAKAASLTTPAWVLFFGDSMSVQAPTDYLNTSHIGLTRAAFAAQGYPIYREFLPVVTYSTMYGGYTGTPPFSAPVTPVTYQAGFGVSAGSSTTSAVTPFTTFTSPANCIGFEIVYIDFVTATPGFSYSVDGGAQVNVNTVGPGTQAGAIVKKVTITGLSNASHTLALYNIAATGLILCGVTVITATNGIGIVRNTYTGIRMVDFTTGAGAATGQNQLMSMPPDKLSLWTGQISSGNGQNAQVNFTDFPCRPSLAIIMIGVNDCSGGVVPKFMASAYKRLIQSVRRGVLNCSIMIVCQSYPDLVNADVNTGGVGFTFHTYKKIMVEMANTYNCAVLDIDSAWQELGFSLGYQAANDFHPLQAGHTWISQQMAALI